MTDERTMTITGGCKRWHEPPYGEQMAYGDIMECLLLNYAAEGEGVLELMDEDGIEYELTFKTIY